jgi:hypothetical protein
LSPAPAKRSGGYGNAVSSSVRPRYVVSALKFWFVDQLISHLHTSIILGISSLNLKLEKIRKKLWEWRPILRCLPKHIKISKCYDFNENCYLEDFRPEECESDKCDLKMAAIAAIMMAILAAIFNMVSKTHTTFRSAPMLQLQRKLIFRGFYTNVIVINAISKWRSFWLPFLRWPPKCVKFRSAPILTKIYM